MQILIQLIEQQYDKKTFLTAGDLLSLLKQAEHIIEQEEIALLEALEEAETEIYRSQAGDR